MNYIYIFKVVKIYSIFMIYKWRIIVSYLIVVIDFLDYLSNL